MPQGTPLAAKMLYAAIFMGYCYQGPPFRCARAACPCLCAVVLRLWVGVEVCVTAGGGHCVLLWR